MRSIKVIAKWTGRILLILMCMFILAYLYVYISTEQRINKKYTYVEPELTIPTDSVSLARGGHLYRIRGCEDCHGSRLEGSVFMNDAKLLQLTAPNLTKGKGGLPQNFFTADWVRVLRHGLDRNGQSLWMMPSHESTVLSKSDLSCLIAFCQSAEPVNSNGQRMHDIGPIGRVLIALDKVAVLPAERIDHYAIAANATPTGDVAQGKYIASVCEGCHRANMKGGAPLAPGFPPVPDISATGAPGKWNLAQFTTAIRTGITPEGKKLRNEFMPWQNMKSFTDDELHAIRSYLLSLN